MVSDEIYIVIPGGIIALLILYYIVKLIVNKIGYSKHRKIAAQRAKQREMEFQSIKNFDLVIQIKFEN